MSESQALRDGWMAGGGLGSLLVEAVQRPGADPSAEADAGYHAGLFVESLGGTAPRRRPGERPRYGMVAAAAALCVAVTLGIASWAPLSAQVRAAQARAAQTHAAQPAQVRR
jgi:hypothetical protein